MSGVPSAGGRITPPDLFNRSLKVPSFDGGKGALTPLSSGAIFSGIVVFGLGVLGSGVV
jgi:hypothetical protein